LSTLSFNCSSATVSSPSISGRIKHSLEDPTMSNHITQRYVTKIKSKNKRPNIPF
jgi:hypothetical protein